MKQRALQNSLENLFAAWKEFQRGKRKKADVQEFELRLEDNVFDLYYALKNGSYQHGGYKSFYVNDPKRRHIHKAAVRDRLLHHAVVRVLTPIFERKFIFDSWSCRKGKGTHRAVNRFQKLAWRLSRNNTRTVWILKLDIRKCFESVNHDALMLILSRAIRDDKALRLLQNIVASFSRGIPLGNLTSQLFVNVYLNELDQFIKHPVAHCAIVSPATGSLSYLRYSDDFVCIHWQKEYLMKCIRLIQDFLQKRLRISLHSDKIVLKQYHRGIDFLGFICFPCFRVLRTKTKRRMLGRVNNKNLASYSGILRHCRSRGLGAKLRQKLWRRD